MSKAIVFAGPPCSGKSTIAKMVSKELKIIYLSMDEIAQQFFPHSVFSLKVRDFSYKQMHLEGKRRLLHGLDVILDATYGREEMRRNLAEIVEQARAKLCLIQLHVSPDVAVNRFLSRNDHPAMDLNEERVKMLAETYPYQETGLILDANNDLGTSVQIIKKWIKNEH